MPTHFVYMETEKAAELVELVAFKDRRGETVIKMLLPGCGSMQHEDCRVMVPRIGTREEPRRFVGWYHCSCDCHEFIETKNGWEAKPSKK